MALAYGPAIPGETKASWLTCGPYPWVTPGYLNKSELAMHKTIAPVVLLDARRLAAGESHVSLSVRATQKSWRVATERSPHALPPAEAKRLRNRLAVDCYSRDVLEQELLAAVREP